MIPSADSPGLPAEPTRDERAFANRRDWLVVLAIALLFGMVFFQHFHTRNEPLERDMPCYAVVAHEVMAGRRLYSDIFDQKPPALYATYAVAEFALGYGQRMIFLLGVFAAWVTLLGVYFAGFKFTGKRWCGVVAAGAWAVLGTDLYMQANQPNSEVFMNACMAWMVALVAWKLPRLPEFRDALLIGLIAALASMYKPVVVVIPVSVIAAMIAYAHIWGEAGEKRCAWIFATTVIGVIAVSWLSLAAYFAATHRFGDFYYAMVSYNRAYAGSVTQNIARSMRPNFLFPIFFRRWMIAMDAVLLLGAVAGARSEQRRNWAILLGYAFGVQIAIALPGKFFAHYYQLWLPLFCIGFGAASGAVLRIRDFRRRRAALAFMCIVALYQCSREVRHLTLDGVWWSRIKYGDEFVDARWIGDHINTWLQPGEVYYDAGNDPEFYFYSNRPVLSGIFYSDATIDKPRSNEFAARLLSDLRNKPPDLITLNLQGGILHPDVKRWMDTNYVREYVAGHDRFFAFYVHPGSAVAERLQSLPTK